MFRNASWMVRIAGCASCNVCQCLTVYFWFLQNGWFDFFSPFLFSSSLFISLVRSCSLFFALLLSSSPLLLSFSLFLCFFFSFFFLFIFFFSSFSCRQRRHRGDFPQYLRLHLRQKSTRLKCEVKECTRKHSGSEPSGQKSAELLDARHVRRPVGGKSHTRECKSYQDAWDESRRTASAEEAKRGIVGDPDTRPLDPSGSSVDPEPKRTKNNLCDRQRVPG